MIRHLLATLLVSCGTLQAAPSLYDDPVVKVRAKVPVLALSEDAPILTLYQEPIPRWVAVLSAPEALDSTLEHGTDVQILLIDKQVNVDTETTYYHIAKRLLSQTGIHQHELVELTFVPTYQTLTLHSLCVRRNGVCMDKIGSGDVHLMQASSAEQAKRWSLVTLVDDVREGDVLEYSYSVKGQNPTNMDRTVDECFFGFPYPVERIYYRVLGLQPCSLCSKAHNAALQFVRRDLGADGWEYVWNAISVPAYACETMQPGWHQDAAWVQISEFKDWSEVSRWGNNLLQPPKILPPSGIIPLK